MVPFYCVISLYFRSISELCAWISLRCEPHWFPSMRRLLPFHWLRKFLFLSIPLGLIINWIVGLAFAQHLLRAFGLSHRGWTLWLSDSECSSLTVIRTLIFPPWCSSALAPTCGQGNNSRISNGTASQWWKLIVII